MKTDLQEAKQARRVTLAALAAEMDVTDSTVSRWLAREAPIPSAKARKLARLLGVAVEDVLPPEDAE
jgi:transcriptional regulator with XRE-family HTH domain